MPGARFGKVAHKLRFDTSSIPGDSSIVCSDYFDAEFSENIAFTFRWAFDSSSHVDGTAYDTTSAILPLMEFRTAPCWDVTTLWDGTNWGDSSSIPWDTTAIQIAPDPIPMTPQPVAGHVAMQVTADVIASARLYQVIVRNGDNYVDIANFDVWATGSNWYQR